MNNRDFTAINRFNAVLEDGLGKLANLWKVSVDDNPLINSVRNAAHIHILGRTNMSLIRMRNDSPYAEHANFFQGLMAQNYTPQLSTTDLKEGTVQKAQALKLLKDLAYHIGHTITREQTVLERIMAPTVNPTADPSWVENGLIPTDNAVDEDGMAGWDAHTVPAGIVIDESTQFKEEQKGIEQIIGGASATDLQNYIAKILKPRADEVRRELQTRRAEFANETAFRLIEGPMINFADKLDTLVAQAVRKVSQAEPKPVANSNTLDARAAVLETRINTHIETLSGQNLRQFYEEQLKPKATAIKAEIDFLELSESDPSLLQTKKKHLDVIVNGMVTSFNKIMDERRAEREAVHSNKPSAPAAPVAIASTAAFTASAAQKAITILDQTEAQRRKAWEDSLPVLTDVISMPQQTSRDVSNATTVSFQEVKAEPKNQGSWLKRAATKVAVGAAWVAGAAAIVFSGAFIGVAGKIAYQDHVRDSKVAAAATEQFNQAAESSPAQRAVDLAKEKGYYSPLTEKATTITSATPTPAPVAVEPVADAKLDVQPAAEVKVTKDPAPVKQAKAKADFKPAADDYKVTYEPLVAKSFDIATSRVGLDTLNNACGFLKANNALVKDGVCPISPERSLN